MIIASILFSIVIAISAVAGIVVLAQARQYSVWDVISICGLTLFAVIGVEAAIIIGWLSSWLSGGLTY
jgi:hypothetical protein